jgi:spore maturation protein CgeB
MRFAWFVHSVSSCWNHGNAHFIRGVARDLVARGHDMRLLAPRAGWSAENMRAEPDRAGARAWQSAYPELAETLYDTGQDLDPLVADRDVVLVHEWTDPAVVAAIGQLRRRRSFTALFHDTHHRAVSDPDAIRTFDLTAYDGVLAFGEALAEVYRRWGWGRHAFVWHEAADTTLFRPPVAEQPRSGLVWIGNWGDGERSAELEAYLLNPARDAGLPLDIYGVRYPPDALVALAATGARFSGWLPNVRAPQVFARHMATVHVPRRFYTTLLPGIPTIRVFEALACGIPLVCAPWEDSEGLFSPGRDFLMARDGAQMTRHLRALVHDRGLRDALAAHGLAKIRHRHSCRHRAAELLAILAGLGVAQRTTARVTA